MWSEPDVTYDGKHFQLDGAQCDPKPVQQPHPQILIGGGGEQLTLRVVARLADASNFGGKPHEFQHKTEVLQQHCKDVGPRLRRDPEDLSPRDLHPRDRGRDRRPAGSQSFWGEPVESWTEGNLVGTPEQVAERIQAVHRPRLHRLLPVVQRLPRHRDGAPLRREGRPRAQRSAGHS